MGRRLLWKRSRGATEEKAKGQPRNFLKEAENSRDCGSPSLGSSCSQRPGAAALPWEPGGVACLWWPPGPWSGPFIRNICSSWPSVSQSGLRAPCNFQAGGGALGICTFHHPIPEGRKG